MGIPWEPMGMGIPIPMNTSTRNCPKAGLEETLRNNGRVFFRCARLKKSWTTRWNLLTCYRVWLPRRVLLDVNSCRWIVRARTDVCYVRPVVGESSLFRFNKISLATNERTEDRKTEADAPDGRMRPLWRRLKAIVRRSYTNPVH